MIHLLLVRDYTPPHAKMLAIIVDAHVDTVDEEREQLSKTVSRREEVI